MAKVTKMCSEGRNRPVFICDFSPPRGADPALLHGARSVDADFLCVAYSPGKSVRVDPVIAAHVIRQQTEKDVVFTLATRDMNKVAIQSMLLGAQLLGLENVAVVMGDRFTDRELSHVQDVSDYLPTELLRSINDLNQGTDFRGRKLRAGTDFCIGATIDLARDMDAEIRLTRRKVESGAQFFISQPTFDPDLPTAFIARYADQYDEELSPPIFHGVQVMAPESIVFGNIPQWVTDDLAKDRPGEDIALQVLDRFTEAELTSIYLVPPILRGGRRDYDAAQAVVEALAR